MSTHRSAIFWSLISSLVLILGLYIYFVQAGIFYLVSARDWGEETQSLALETRALEAEYYKLASSISEQLAREAGFVDATRISIIKTDTDLGVSLNSRGGAER